MQQNSDSDCESVSSSVATMELLQPPGENPDDPLSMLVMQMFQHFHKHHHLSSSDRIAKHQLLTACAPGGDQTKFFRAIRARVDFDLDEEGKPSQAREAKP